MPTYIALLRAVNVGGTGKLPMTELKAMCAAEGFSKVQTYIASGNVVLDPFGPAVPASAPPLPGVCAPVGCTVAVCACSTPPHPTPQQQRRTHQQSHPSGLKHGAERRAGVAAATATATVRGKVLEGTTAGNRRRVNPHGEVARAPSPDARSPRRSHNGFFHRHRGWAGGRERPHEAGRGGPSQPPKPPDKPPAAAAGGGDGAQTTTPEKWASGVVGDNERCAWKFERCG